MIVGSATENPIRGATAFLLATDEMLIYTIYCDVSNKKFNILCSYDKNRLESIITKQGRQNLKKSPRHHPKNLVALSIGDL